MTRPGFARAAAAVFVIALAAMAMGAGAPTPYPNNQFPGPVVANPPICSDANNGSPDAGTSYCVVFPATTTCLRVSAGFTANINYRKSFLPDGGTASASDKPLAAGAVEKGCFTYLPDGGNDKMPDAGYAMCFLLSAAAPEAGVVTCP